jgi:Ca2+-binding EF-hand superfamily protein
VLKLKFQNCFESVRKAFLILDTDSNGTIEVEDLLKYLGNDQDMNYDDLKKLLIDKDSRKIGKLSYADFSRWMGTVIH